VLTIAWLTGKEALRRRAPLISLLITVLLLVGAFIPLSGRLLLLPRPEANRIYSSIYIALSTDIVKFFASVFAIALASGAISSELERGVLSSILPKPMSRLSVYAGKWLGLFLFVATNLFVWAAVIWGVAAYRAPEMSHTGIWKALPYLLLYPAVFVTLGLLFSAFASFPLAAGLSILFTGVGWSEGVLYLLNQAFDIRLLATLSTAAGYLMPIGRMSRWVTRALGPLPLVGDRQIGGNSPFGEIEAVPFDLVYIGLYVAAAFVIGAVVLGRRDV
jgi:ABC-type transport system involved in multi-copper enzyme maturation permease subunit